MRGRSSHCTPGFLRRRGPIQATGLARSDQIGSVKMFDPLCWSSNVEWLIKVTRSSLPSTREGGFDGVTSETKCAHFSGRLVSFHFNALRNPRAWGAPGLKKRFPSKCRGKGGATGLILPESSLYTRYQVPGNYPRVEPQTACSAMKRRWSISSATTAYLQRARRAQLKREPPANAPNSAGKRLLPRSIDFLYRRHHLPGDWVLKT
jgi:hypothetical protein